MGNRSLKTRSRPMSSRSCEAASSCSSASKARVWMSRRCGIAIPLSSSLPNEISFINSGMSHPRTGKTAVAPASPREMRGDGATVVLRLRLWCRAAKYDARRRRSEGQGARSTARGGRRMTPIHVRGRRRPLLHFDDRALLFQLGPDTGRLVLADTRLHRLRSAVDKVLRFLEAQAGQLAHDLDDLDLLRTGFLERDRELGLLLGGRSRRAAGAAGRGCRRAYRRRRDRDVEPALESLDEVGELEDRHVADRLEDLVLAQSRVSHGSSLS